MVILVGTTIMVLGIQWLAPIYAAPSNTSKLASCDPIALAGNIVIYFCEPDDGPSFYVNSVGFMFPTD